MSKENKTFPAQIIDTQEKIDSKFKALMDASPDPIVIYDNMGKATYMNPSFEKVYGFTPEEVIGEKINFVPEDELEKTVDAWQRTMKGEKVYLETRRYTKAGKILNIQMSTAIIKDKNQNHLESIVIHRDITDQKRAEEAVQESEEKHRSALEAAVDPIIIYNKEGLVTYFNPAFSRIFKWSLEERINTKMDDFVPKDNWPETKKMIDMVIAGEFFSGIETARYDKLGNIIPVSISGSTFRDKNDEVIGSVINIQDISERKLAEEIFIQQEKLKGVLEMAGAVCHELSQPAMIIAGHIEILLMTNNKDNFLYDKVNKIKEQVDRIGILTKKLMNIAKYETREYSKGKKIVDIDKASQ